MIKEIIQFFTGKRVEVSQYNNSVMNKPKFKTTISGSVCMDFFQWSQQQRISTMCQKNLNFSPDTEI